MASTMKTKDVIHDLNDLIELEYDAIAAYTSAIERIDNPAFKSKLSDFLADHDRHVDQLTQAVVKEGGVAKKEGDAKKFLTKGKVVLADMAGDKAILKAMKSNEEQTNTEYEKAVKKGYAAPIQAVLQQGLDDERRHKAWVESTLQAL